MRGKISKKAWVPIALLLGWSLSLVFLSGCRLTRHLEPGQYLLQNYPSVKESQALPKSALETSLRTRPNRRMLIPKTYLALYNVGMDLKKDTTWWRKLLIRIPPIQKADSQTVNWLIKAIGEAPVVLTHDMLTEDSVSLYQYCFSKGYFHPEISFSVDTASSKPGRRLANINYVVREGVAYQIDTVTYTSPAGPESPLEFFYRKEESLLKPGTNYDQAILAQERIRATNSLRNEGFFSFNQNLIRYEVDSLPGRTSADSAAGVRKVALEVQIVEAPRSYFVREIRVQMKSPADEPDMRYNFSMRLRSSELKPEDRERLKLGQELLHDSVQVTFVVSPKLLYRVNYNYLASRIFLREGELFRQNDARKTQQYLQELGMIQYLVVSNQPDDSAQAIDVTIDIMMSPQYQVKTGMETFTTNFASSNLPSLGATFSLRNKNLFRHSEFLELALRGNVGFYAGEANASQFDRVFYEVAGNLNLNFHQIFLPKFLGVRESLGSSTQFSTSYRQESRREFERAILGFNYNYIFAHAPYNGTKTSRLTPLGFDLIDVTIRDDSFQNQVLRLPPFIRRDFERRFSSRVRYQFTDTDLRTTRARPSRFLQYAGEIGGNLPFLLDAMPFLSKQDAQSGDNLLFNRLLYGQYLKASVEGRYSLPLGPKTEIALRGMVGGSLPFNGTPAVPQESRFFSGGTNSLRGWQSNTLGPGRSSLSDFLPDTSNFISSLIAPGGEYILEMNAEYRFDVWYYLEMAVFTDVGNVWFNNTAINREQLGEKSVLSWENFALGWDAGVGFRFDFSFLILRIDIAQQLIAPDLERRWVPGNAEDGRTGLQLNLGIGYPF